MSKKGYSRANCRTEENNTLLLDMRDDIEE